MKREELIQNKAEKIQEECNSFVRDLMSRPMPKPKGGKLMVQDCINVWFFRKLAEMQLEIEKTKLCDFNTVTE